MKITIQRGVKAEHFNIKAANMTLLELLNKIAPPCIPDSLLI